MNPLSYSDEETKDEMELFDQNSFKKRYSARFEKKKDKLPADKVAAWLSSYLKQEEYKDINTVRLDLDDPQHSHLRQKLGDKFQNEIDEKTANEVITFLRDDIFCDSEMGYLTGVTNSTRTSVIFDESLIDGSGIFHHELGRYYDEAFDDSMIVEDSSQTDNEISPKLADRIMNSDLNLLKLNKPNDDNSLPGLARLPTIEHGEVQIEEDEYTSHQEPFPEFINVALFGMSDDEFLERLIDKAISKLCFSRQFEKLWNDKKFVKQIYSDTGFPDAVNKIYNKINTDNDGLEFIGEFVSEQFKRQINEHKRMIEAKALLTEKSVNNNQNSDDDDDDDDDDEDENKYNNENEDGLYVIYTVEMDDKGEYIINHDEDDEHHKLGINLGINKHSNVLYELRVDEDFDDDEFCWAVFKKKKVQNNYGIKCKGFWEIIERDDDNARENKKKEQERKKKCNKQIMEAVVIS